MANWVMISAITTGGGTLVLAGATFASVRSANRASRAAEQSLLSGLRPLLMTSRAQDPALKVGFADNHFVQLPGGSATAEATDSAIYLTLSVRNVGNGMAILHGWRVELSREITNMSRPDVSAFHRLTRDLYVAVGDVSFWQGAYRDPTEQEFSEVTSRIVGRERLFLDILYGDHQGGQRVVSRFLLFPRGDDGYFVSVARHWNVDEPDPR
jgi:hypothetical protein